MRKNAAMLLDGIIQLTMINTKNKMFVQSQLTLNLLHVRTIVKVKIFNVTMLKTTRIILVNQMIDMIDKPQIKMVVFKNGITKYVLVARKFQNKNLIIN